MAIRLHLRPIIEQSGGQRQGGCTLLRRWQRATLDEQARQLLRIVGHGGWHRQGDRGWREEIPGRAKPRVHKLERRRVQGAAETTAGDETEDRVG